MFRDRRRILVIGSPGAGKSTFARTLGDLTGLGVIYGEDVDCRDSARHWRIFIAIGGSHHPITATDSNGPHQYYSESTGLFVPTRANREPPPAVIELHRGGAPNPETNVPARGSMIAAMTYRYTNRKAILLLSKQTPERELALSALVLLLATF